MAATGGSSTAEECSWRHSGSTYWSTRHHLLLPVDQLQARELEPEPPIKAQWWSKEASGIILLLIPTLVLNSLTSGASFVALEGLKGPFFEAPGLP